MKRWFWIISKQLQDFYLVIWKTEKKEIKMAMGTPIHWFSPKYLSCPESGSDWKRSPKQCSSPGVAACKLREPAWLLRSVCSREAGVRSRARTQKQAVQCMVLGSQGTAQLLDGLFLQKQTGFKFITIPTLAHRKMWFALHAYVREMWSNTRIMPKILKNDNEKKEKKKERMHLLVFSTLEDMSQQSKWLIWHLITITQQEAFAIKLRKI